MTSLAPRSRPKSTRSVLENWPTPSWTSKAPAATVDTAVVAQHADDAAVVAGHVHVHEHPRRVAAIGDDLAHGPVAWRLERRRAQDLPVRGRHRHRGRSSLVEGLGGGRRPCHQHHAGCYRDEGGAPAAELGRADVGPELGPGSASQLLVQAGHELLVGLGVARSGRSQGDGRAQDFNVVRAGREAARTAPRDQGIYERREASVGHWPRSWATLAAMCKARCWRTLALLTLTSMVLATSLIEHASRKRSSRTRR